MSQTKEKKGFNPVAYAIIAGVGVAVALVVITIFAFTTRYTAFNPEKVAVAYADTIVQTGDGYNAYKNTLVSRNMKYGDFIRAAYMAPYVNEDAPKADFVADGTQKTEEETKAINSVYSSMYNYYTYIAKTNTWDDYDAMFTNYFEMYSVVKPATYGDEYIDTEYLFGALEANVAQYGRELTGTEEVLADDDKTVLQEKTIGKYQEMYGEDYKLTVAVTETTDLNDSQFRIYLDSYKKRITKVIEKGEAKADKIENEEIANAMRDAYHSLDNSGEIEAVKTCTVAVTTDQGETVATAQIFVVKIGNSWYVDNTNTDTSALYLAQ